MQPFRKKIYVAAGYNKTFFGPGRKEFDSSKPMPGFESYLKEAAEGVVKQVKTVDFDEGIIGSFMAAGFLKQANLPGFLPFMIPNLLGKPCTGVEGACGTGGRAIGRCAQSSQIYPTQRLFAALKSKIRSNRFAGEPTIFANCIATLNNCTNLRARPLSKWD